MSKSPFMDAIEALEDIREYCEKRESSYKGWGDDAQAFDMRQLKERVDKAIKELTPNFPKDE
tara:strand:+ start:93 stop:278 length:186 start_codon:yes stop_codon:yes gene_type:complete